MALRKIDSPPPKVQKVWEQWRAAYPQPRTDRLVVTATGPDDPLWSWLWQNGQWYEGYTAPDYD